MIYSPSDNTKKLTNTPSSSFPLSFQINWLVFVPNTFITSYYIVHYTVSSCFSISSYVLQSSINQSGFLTINLYLVQFKIAHKSANPDPSENQLISSQILPVCLYTIFFHFYLTNSQYTISWHQNSAGYNWWLLKITLIIERYLDSNSIYLFMMKKCYDYRILHNYFKFNSYFDCLTNN